MEYGSSEEEKRNNAVLKLEVLQKLADRLLTDGVSS